MEKFIRKVVEMLLSPFRMLAETGKDILDSIGL
jgi:hypothetical protein